MRVSATGKKISGDCATAISREICNRHKKISCYRTINDFLNYNLMRKELNRERVKRCIFSANLLLHIADSSPSL